MYSSVLARTHLGWRFLTASLLCLLISCICTPVISAAAHHLTALVGPKPYYLALGDSLAYGYQPDLDLANGYTIDLFRDLETRGALTVANMGCPGESSTTFVNGGCPASLVRKYPYHGTQLNAALSYLALHRGQVSPVTLDIGANDVLPDISAITCMPNISKFYADLAILDTNLSQVILPRLYSALLVNGNVTGDLALMNYYDPYQNMCPATLPYLQELNQHLAADVAGYGSVVDVFSAFGGPTIPDTNLCSYTWICSSFRDVHSRTLGYSVIAHAFEARLGY